MPSSTSYIEPTHTWTSAVAFSGFSSWIFWVSLIWSSPPHLWKNLTEWKWTPAWSPRLPATVPTDHGLSGWITSCLTLWTPTLESRRGRCCHPFSSPSTIIILYWFYIPVLYKTSGFKLKSSEFFGRNKLLFSLPTMTIICHCTNLYSLSANKTLLYGLVTL